MYNFASATIDGFVTREPVVRKTKTGKTVCNFSLAVNHFYGEKSEPKVSYIDVETWEKVAEICSNHVDKGKRLIVIGYLRQDRWENDEGKVQSRVKVIGNEIRFLESRHTASVAEPVAETG